MRVTFLYFPWESHSMPAGPSAVYTIPSNASHNSIPIQGKTSSGRNFSRPVRQFPGLPSLPAPRSARVSVLLNYMPSCRDTCMLLFKGDPRVHPRHLTLDLQPNIMCFIPQCTRLVCTFYTTCTGYPRRCSSSLQVSLSFSFCTLLVHPADSTPSDSCPIHFP